MMQGSTDTSSVLAPGEEAVMLHQFVPPVLLPATLQPSRLGSYGGAYVPNFLSVDEEQTLMREVRMLLISTVDLSV